MTPDNDGIQHDPTNSFIHPEDRLVVAVRVRPHTNEDLRRVMYVLDHKTVVLQERDGARLDEVREKRLAEQESHQSSLVVQDKDSARLDVLRQRRGGERQYEFDLVFGEKATQESVYEGTTRALIQRVVRGGNATVLAYGATGSGKTFTMVGTAQQPGVMVRALDDLFREASLLDEAAVDSGAADSDSTGSGTSNQLSRQVVMSYLEVYNEKIRDLLNPSSGQLDLREDSQGGVRVTGLSEVFATSTEEVLRLLQRGNRARSVEPTAANKTSSRSHAMLQVSVIGRGQPEGRLLMVDLAGSERASNTMNRGKRLMEGAHINLSLLALGNCITALARGGDVRHINFRDSKLTRLLKGALTAGGGRRLSCVMIAHVAPGSLQREESRTTLLYAERAARISLAAAQTSRPAGFAAAQATLRAEKRRLRSEIERMRARLGEDEEEEETPPKVAATTMNTNNDEVIKQSTKIPQQVPTSVLQNKSQQLQVSQQQQVDMDQEEEEEELANSEQAEMADLKEQIVAAFRDQMRARRRLLEVDSQLLSLNMQAERHSITLRRWEAKHGQLYRAARLGTATKAKGPPATARSNKIARGARGRQSWLTDPEDSDVPGSQQLELEAQQAWREVSRISREQERLQAVRASAQAELESCKRRAQQLEQELTSRVGSAWGEREVLALVCRVHELELERLEAHAEALAREHELRRRQSALRRHERQRNLCDQIITKQRQIIEDREVDLPAELEQLYSEYLREVHASSFLQPEDTTGPASLSQGTSGDSGGRQRDIDPSRLSLPPVGLHTPGFPSPTTPLYQIHSPRSQPTPRSNSQSRHDPEMMQISTPNSSGDSGRESPLPPIKELSFSIGEAMQLIAPLSSGESTSPLLPPIRTTRSSSTRNHTSFGHPPTQPVNTQSRLPRPLPRKSRSRMRRSASNEDMRKSNVNN